MNAVPANASPNTYKFFSNPNRTKESDPRQFRADKKKQVYLKNNNENCDVLLPELHNESSTGNTNIADFV